MKGRAEAPAAGTVLNALANGYGCAFAIDDYVRAEVQTNTTGEITGEVAGAPDADTELVETCAEMVLEKFGHGDRGAHVTTESEVPMAGGLKSSSAAANATLLATADALDQMFDVDLGREEALHIGVTAARRAGVTVTGALDDASASMLGGVSLTNNHADQVLNREEFDHDVLVYTPDEQAFSAEADTSRCTRIRPMADHVRDLAENGQFATGMTVNGFAFCAALDFPTEPMIEAMPEAEGVSLSGTGPSYVAIGEKSVLKEVHKVWDERDGTTWLTTTQNEGARRLKR